MNLEICESSIEILILDEIRLQIEMESNKFFKEDRGTIENSGSFESNTSNFVFNPNHKLPIYAQRSKLPIYALRSHILYLLEKYQVLVIVGETGCGKSSQVPQYLLETGYSINGKLIGITQPRRIAAVSLAARVAEERNCSLGCEVGYTIRFDNCTNSDTKVKFLTDGMLVREMLGDPLLSKYSVIMLDEAHERSVNTDIAAGLLKKILKKRKDLRIVVSSATIDAHKIKDYFNFKARGSEGENAAILSVEGRNYPVDVFYSKHPVADYVVSAVETVIVIHKSNAPGDVLVFLTGQDEVEEACKMLKDKMKHVSQKLKYSILPIPMYSNLPARDQLKVFQRASSGTRKVIFSTNIAETSITIDNIIHIVDCGFMKTTVYDPTFNSETLAVVPISQASAKQRAGRAGRLTSGKCYRLYSESEYAKLLPQSVPEMQRSSMAFPVLQLKALGVNNVAKFDYLSPPPATNMARALELLYSLGAIDARVELINPVGHQMAELPLNPMFSKCLLVSQDFDCSEEIVTLCAMMQVKNVLYSPSSGKEKQKAASIHREFYAQEGDHMTLLNVFTAFTTNNRSKSWCDKHYASFSSLNRAFNIREQLLKYLRRFNVELSSARGFDDVKILKCLCAGFFANAAMYTAKGCFKSLRKPLASPDLHIHPDSVLYTVPMKSGTCVIFTETAHSSKMFLRECSVVKSEWLLEVAPHYYTST